jgi:hypothetical protein
MVFSIFNSPVPIRAMGDGRPLSGGLDIQESIMTFPAGESEKPYTAVHAADEKGMAVANLGRLTAPLLT